MRPGMEHSVQGWNKGGTECAFTHPHDAVSFLPWHTFPRTSPRITTCALQNTEKPYDEITMHIPRNEIPSIQPATFTVTGDMIVPTTAGVPRYAADA